MPGKSKIQISRSLDERIKRIISGSDEYQNSEFAQVDTAYILGFHQANITNCVGLTTNYQLHHAVFPVVGLVFFKTSPSDDEIKESLKSVKEFSSSPNGLGSFKSDKNEHLFLIYSVETTKQSTNNKDVTTTVRDVEKRIFNFTKGTFVRRRKLRLNVLQDPYCPRQVHRGPEDLLNIGDNDSMSSDDDHVDHLIFFIHGVGGVCDVRFRSCVEVVADFKKMANNLLAQQSNPSSGSSTPSSRSQQSNSKRGSFFRKYSTDSNSSGKSNCDNNPSEETTPIDGVSPIPPSSSCNNLLSNRININRARKVECLPISWHSCTRRQTGMNDQLSLIALNSVPKLRHFLNKVVMDALLYSSGPVYAQTIINNVGDEINRLYTLFMEKHPNFNGSVSLAGHSLGCVIVFDLLANQIASDNQDMCREDNNSKETNNNMNIDKLPCESNNNNENNNNEGEHFNKRMNCRNVSHHHNNFYSSQEIDSCDDYKNLDELLLDMNLTQYADIFHKEHVDINTLLLLTDLDMKELNLPVGVRRKLGTYINFKKVSMKPINNIKLQQNNQSLNNNNNNNNNNNSNSSFDQSMKSNNNLCDNINTGQFLINYPQLKFKPKCFFSFGSPMPMFLNIRGMEDISKEYKLPTCDRMFNIFHPYDPLAYRIEPLIDPRFKNIEPVQIPHHRGGKRIHVQLREGFARVGHDIKHRLFGSIRDTWTSFTRFSTSTTAEPPTASSTAEAKVESTTSVNSSMESSTTNKDRKRLTKSASSSIDVEVESFEKNLIHHLPIKLTATNKQRRQLKRQQQLARSQSDLTNVTTLDSILEGSVRQSMDMESDSGATMLDSLTLNEQPESTEPIVLGTEKVKKCDGEPVYKRKKKLKVKDLKLDDEEDSANFNPTKVGKLNGGRRLDYVLQEKPIELFNEYIFAFTSHANYWQNEDSALIILNEIYQEDGMFECFE